MKKLFYTLLISFLASNFLFAQLEPGSIAPDFTITDLDGNTHNLYDILDQGKPVLLDLFATWCGPCWTFAETGVFDQFDELYGANGNNSAFTMAIESDPTTSISELTSSALGDWTTVIHYPLANDDQIGDAYSLEFYPTIYLICPDRRVQEIGQGPAGGSGYWTVESLAQEVFVNTCPAPVEGLNAMMQSYDSELVSCGGGKIEPIVTIMNMGTEDMTSCSIQTTIAGDVINTYSWTGSLSTFDSDQITLPEIPANTTNVSFSIVMDGDLEPSDDIIDIEIEFATESHAYIHVQFNADFYPGETSWDIRNSNGSVVFQSSYQDGNADQWNGGGPDADMTHNHFTELSEGCYTFNAYDSFGDGQSGYSGSGAGADGSIVVTDGNGNELLFISGNWGSDVTSHFEVTSGVGIEEVLENSISVYPNPTFNNTTLSLNLIESNQVIIELVNTIGQKVFTKEYQMIAGLNNIPLLVENLNVGIYYLNIIVDDKIITEKLNILK